MLFNSIFILLSATAAMAAVASLPSGTVTCGSDRYSVSAITAAINAGVKDMQSGNLPGMYSFFMTRYERGDQHVFLDDYPHQYYEYASILSNQCFS